MICIKHARATMNSCLHNPRQQCKQRNLLIFAQPRLFNTFTNHVKKLLWWPIPNVEVCDVDCARHGNTSRKINLRQNESLSLIIYKRVTDRIFPQKTVREGAVDSVRGVENVIELYKDPEYGND